MGDVGSGLGRAFEVIPRPGSDPLVFHLGYKFRLSEYTGGRAGTTLDRELQALIGEKLRRDSYLPALDQWRVVYCNDERALVTADVGSEVAFFEFVSSGRGWAPLSSSVGPLRLTCALPAELGPGLWEFNPAFPSPMAADTQVHLLVTERSGASGAPIGERLRGPDVVEDSDCVAIAFGVVRRTGFQTDEGNPALEVTVELKSPIGTRSVVDGMIVEVDRSAASHPGHTASDG